jgi:GntR family transcriptional regulator
LYEQLAGILRDKIQAGQLTGRIPSIISLAQEYEVSHNTAYRALGILRDEGLIVAGRGRGYYVR